MTSKQYSWLQWILYLFFIVQFVLLVAPDVLPCLEDALEYVHDINSSIPGSWHSPFFIYELKILNFLAEHAISGISSLASAILPSSMGATIVQQCHHWLEESGIQAIRFLWGSTLIMFFCSLLFFFRKLIQKDKAYMLSLAIFSLSLSFLLQFRYFYFVKYVDAYFCHFAITAALALFFAKEATGKKRLFLYICFFILLIHCILYRKNAFFITPVYLYYFIRQIIPHRNGLQPFLYTAAATLSLLALCFCINISLPAKKQYPLSAMMISDIQIASRLSGNDEVLKRIGQDIHTYNPPKNAVIGPVYGIDKFGGRHLNQSEWNALVLSYKEMCCNHPKEMFMSHIIQAVQFFCNGYIPHSLRKGVLYLCPKAPTKPIAHGTGGLTFFLAHQVAMKKYGSIWRGRGACSMA